jgi:5-methylcytosine-specific restriction protein A
MPRRPCLECGALTRGTRCPAHTQRQGSTRAWRNLREQILYRDDWRCQECGALATHVDHIVAHANGGSDHHNNLQALCETCNLRKGAR